MGQPSELWEIRHCIGELIEDVCSRLGERLASLQEENVDQQILAYIEQNLFKPELSLSSVAERHGKTVSYVSLLFKRAKDMNYNDYVNQARVIRAIALMTEEGRSAKEACEAVGYISYFTFRRNFKKYTNRTPQEIRLREQKETRGRGQEGR